MTRPLTRASRTATARASAYAWKLAIVLAISVGGVWTATHGVAGASWHDVLAVIGGVTLGRLALLALIWFGGLVIYSTVLAVSLPGLGMRRGLLLNLTGSAVANVMPLGGAVATALNWRMVRSWGHSHGAFASYFVLTNALDVVTKLLLPPVAVAGLVFLSLDVPATVWVMTAACVAALVVIGALHAWTRHKEPAATDPDRPAPSWRAAALARIDDVFGRVHALLAEHWSRLLPASAAYLAAQILLLLVSLRSVGLQPSLALVVMAAAIERLATLVPVTPAGAGFAELGTIAWLVAMGLDPVPVVAGVLLYRVFLVVMEIPVGGALLTVWAWLNRGQRLAEPAAAP